MLPPCAAGERRIAYVQDNEIVSHRHFRVSSTQALKLVKQIMAVDPSSLPREVVRTVVAVSGHKEDNFRRVGMMAHRQHVVFTIISRRSWPEDGLLASCGRQGRNATIIAREERDLDRLPEDVGNMRFFPTPFGQLH